MLYILSLLKFRLFKGNVIIIKFYYLTYIYKNVYYINYIINLTLLLIIIIKN